MGWPLFYGHNWWGKLSERKSRPLDDFHGQTLFSDIPLMGRKKLKLQYVCTYTYTHINCDTAVLPRNLPNKNVNVVVITISLRFHFPFSLPRDEIQTWRDIRIPVLSPLLFFCSPVFWGSPTPPWVMATRAVASILTSRMTTGQSGSSRKTTVSPKPSKATNLIKIFF